MKNIEIPNTNMEPINNDKFGSIYTPENIIEFGKWIYHFTLEINTISGWRGQANVNWNIERVLLEE